MNIDSHSSASKRRKGGSCIRQKKNILPANECLTRGREICFGVKKTDTTTGIGKFKTLSAPL